MLGLILPGFGIEPERVRLEWVAASEGERFATIVDEFTDQIRELGPLKVRDSLEMALSEDVILNLDTAMEEGGDADEA